MFHCRRTTTLVFAMLIVGAAVVSAHHSAARVGWSRTSVAVGDSVEVSTNPMRDGSHGAGCVTLKLVNRGITLNCSGADAIRAGEKTTLP